MDGYIRLAGNRTLGNAGGIELAANAGLIVALFLAFYVGFGLPIFWAINYYIPSFFDGFGRRSLVGTLLYPFGSLRFEYVFVAALQMVVRYTLIVILFWRAWHSPLTLKLVVIAFLLAPTGGYLFHTAGYPEDILYLALLAAIHVRPLPALLIMGATLFVQELAAFTVIPLYVTSLALRREFRTAIVHGAVLVAVFAVIYLFFQTVPSEMIEALLARVRSVARYPVDESYYQLFRNDFVGERMRNYYMPPARYLTRALLMAACVSVVVAVAFYRRSDRWFGVLNVLCVLGACLAPLLLGFFGWDVFRWVFLSLLSSLFVLLFIGRTTPAPAALTVAGLLVGFALVGHLEYFDGAHPRPILPYPRFVDFWQSELPRIIGQALSR